VNTSSSTNIKPQRIFILLLCVVLAIRVVEFYFLGSSSLTIDESGSWWVLSGTFNETLQRAAAVQGQSPFYYVLLRCWADIFDSSETSLRAFSFIIYLLPCFALYRFERKKSPRFAPALTAVYLSSADIFQFSISARPYALVVSLIILGTIEYCNYFDFKKNKHLIFCALLWILSIEAHYFSVLVLPAAFLTAVFACKQYRQMRSISLSFIGILLFVVLINLGQIFSIFKRTNSLSYLAPLNANPLYWIDFSPLWLLLISLAFGLLLELVERKKPLKPLHLNELEKVSLLIGIYEFLIPFIAIVIIAFCFSVNLVVPRYLAVSYAGLVFLGAFLPLLFAGDLARITALASLITCSVIAGLAAEKDFDRQGLKEMAGLQSQYPGCITLATPGFIETWDPAFIANGSTGGFAASPFNYYLIRTDKTLPLAFETPEQKLVYKDVLEIIKDKECVALMTYDSPVNIKGKQSTYPKTAEILMKDLIKANLFISLRKVFGEFTFEVYRDRSRIPT
jgi:hypothetical protein